MDKKYGLLIIGTVILSLGFVGDASAKTWYVDDDGGSDFRRIQDAITNASALDTVTVSDGTYNENMDVNKRLTINRWHIQEDIVRGVRMHVLEALTPSLQIAEKGTTASYYIVVENLGNSPDTFKLARSSVDNPEISSLNKDTLYLGAGDISTNPTITNTTITKGNLADEKISANETKGNLTDEKTPLAKENIINTTTPEVESPQNTTDTVVKPSVEMITLNVSDNEPGIYTVKVEIISRHDNTVKDSIETRTIVPGRVASELINSPTITKSAIIISSINNSVINTSAIINSFISDSTITGSIITNSEVVSTSLNDVIVEDAVVSCGDIISGNITLNEIRYEISNKTRIYDLILGADYSDSTLVGIINKTLEINAKNTNISFDIYAKKDYFAGSMSVQKSTIPPKGIPEFRHNVGGYVYVNVSDNLANSTSWLIIKVFYDQNELDDLDEGSLRLRYFNETADAPVWEFIPISGINPIENYVWGNISHCSTFALSVQPSPPGSEDTDGGGGWIRDFPEEITLLIANLGNNIFNFEWLGHDITKVLIDLESMKINAKVALKKVDTPAEFPDPPGIVYGYFDISTNIEPEKIRASKIHFKILKSWTVFNDVTAETIKLWRYANGWEELETTKIKEDDNYLYFYAETKGFSLFAITSEKRALDVTPTAPAPTAATPASTPTAPTPTPPSESPVPSPPVHPAPVSLTGRLIIIVAIVASAIIVSVTYLVLKRRKA